MESMAALRHAEGPSSLLVAQWFFCYTRPTMRNERRDAVV